MYIYVYENNSEDQKVSGLLCDSSADCIVELLLLSPFVSFLALHSTSTRVLRLYCTQKDDRLGVM